MNNDYLLQELAVLTEGADLPLKATANNLVFGKGNPYADLVIIGEAPGRNEDLQGVPFVGAAGKQLDALLASIGLSLDDVYIANILKYRPPHNRDPSREEVVAHTPYLLEQLRIIKPGVIVTLGNYATRYVLSGFDPEAMKGVSSIGQVHGQIFKVASMGVEASVIPLYHPAATLYNNSLRAVLAEDVLRVGELLASLDMHGSGKARTAFRRRNDRQSTLF